VKLYEFKELYKKYPCEFNFTFCEDEKNLKKWYKFLLSLKNVDKLHELFNFWKNKF